MGLKNYSLRKTITEQVFPNIILPDAGSLQNREKMDVRSRACEVKYIGITAAPATHRKVHGMTHPAGQVILSLIVYSLQYKYTHTQKASAIHIH